MKESRHLEFKSEISNSFLKTVSAFSNIGDGIIRFGVDDSGNAIGLYDLEKQCLDIENKINDSITPNPNFKFDINYKNKTIDLIVYEGSNKPYLYKSKAYKRNDLSTIEMDYLELQRLILEGKNLYYEELEYKDDLKFEYLKKCLEQTLDVHLSNDILKTLGLINDYNKYNNAAALFSDDNKFPGIDIVKFGKNINEIKDRLTLKNVSILNEYDESYIFFERYYTYELVEGKNRKKIELIPINAFREALANAIIHRVWDDTPNIRISMFDDKIIITSPGGLPFGISKEEYLKGQVSKLRNPIIANVFFRLHYIEMFGTGILRIKECYKNYSIQPNFEISENSISITLPVIDKVIELSKDEKTVYDFLKNGMIASSSNLVKMTGFSKDKTLRIIKSLIEKSYINKTGTGKSTKYMI